MTAAENGQPAKDEKGRGWRCQIGGRIKSHNRVIPSSHATQQILGNNEGDLIGATLAEGLTEAGSMVA